MRLTTMLAAVAAFVAFVPVTALAQSERYVLRLTPTELVRVLQRIDITETTTPAMFTVYNISYWSNGSSGFLNEVPSYEVTYSLPFNMPSISIGHGGIWGFETKGLTLQTAKEVWGYEVFVRADLFIGIHGKIGFGPIARNTENKLDIEWFVIRAELGWRF